MPLVLCVSNNILVTGETTMESSAAVTEAIARSLRAHRTQRGWTLESLAARSGVSRNMLVQIEQARTNPSIATLCRIADALAVTVAQLVEVAQAPAIRVVKAGEIARLWTGAPGSVGSLLVGIDAPSNTELWDWRLAPGDGYDGEPHPPGTRELVYVLEGALTIALGRAEHLVEAGEAAMFMGDRPHSYRNDGEVALRLVMTVVQPVPAEAPGRVEAPAGPPSHAPPQPDASLSDATP
jgi:transcriptional regulator with XRE-family HTH domain